jgi:hypothetical protein
MAAPEEVVASPLTIYLAVVGTAFPAIDDAEGTFGVAWEKLGVAGSNNYDDSGVSLSHAETVNDFTPAGSTMPTKRFRTAESFETKLNLVDLSPASYAKVMNDATITTVAAGVGVAGEESFSLFRGDQVNSFALLARGLSPINNDLNMQYEFSKAFVSVNGDAVFKKGVPVALPISILAVKHATTDVIICRIQSAPAT